jgi:two-component system sensor histidine kinase MprB
MTFRTRLVLAASVAVVLAVLAASVASYFAARNSLLNSVDGTLAATATSIITHGGTLGGAEKGVGDQYVNPSGTVLQKGDLSLPITSQVKAVAAGRQHNYYDTIALNGQDYREFVKSIGTVRVRVVNPSGVFETTTTAALQVVLPLTSVDSQLSSLGLTLTLVALGGIALALVLAWLVGRTALVPLYDLTSSVEEVAETTDVSKRLDPGGSDELGRLRRAFNHLLSALERSRESQRQLVLDAGHELRTPLTSLRTNLEVVRRLDELSPDEREVLVDDVLTQLAELTTLVADLSELARGEQRQAPSSALRLDRLVEDAVALATTHGRRRDVHFSLHTEPVWVKGQRERLSRAVGNLLDNALKWSPDGSEVEVYCLGGAVTVRDHGPGIDPDDLPHIFDRFYRAPAARALPGSGLGLAIVAQVAEAEDGAITASNAEDGGAVFQLALPPSAPPIGPPDADDDDER